MGVVAYERISKGISVITIVLVQGLVILPSREDSQGLTNPRVDSRGTIDSETLRLSDAANRRSGSISVRL
jgi:hypothetical protein